MNYLHSGLNRVGLMVFVTTVVVVAILALAGCGPGAGVPTTPGTGSPGGSPIAGTPDITITATVTGTPGITATITVTGTPSPWGSPTLATPYPRQEECPNLESKMYGLFVSRTPGEYARDKGIYYADGRARVVIELKSPTGDVPSGYDMTVEARSGELVQALVPIRDLCRLSNDPTVRYVRAPMGPLR